ncbi:class I SAM-dependent methyltransferase [Streptomyces sp. NPDC059816]|uniref:class I SAM-dependent methyltransferase n=1 Tax=Streptomyces sp. NPDC059816 TaxID=3346960 RepID=UPI00365F2F49
MPPQQASAAEPAAIGPRPLPPVAPGTATRPACPWCGSTSLRTKVRATLVPGSPVEECRDCAHVFRGPTSATPDATPAAGHCARPAARSDRAHRAAARALLPFGEPESWLDVGTGTARFPAAARSVHPYTAFDGVDGGYGAGDSADGARALADGLLDEAHRGTLVDLAPHLAGRYDVLSMFRHLEHVPDPRAELRAGHRALRPGGHLLVEGSDPLSRSAALLGRWWAPYHRPGTRHLIPEANLRRELRALGYTVVLVDRRAAHQSAGPGAAVTLLLSRRRPAAGAPSGAARTLLALGRALDRVLAPVAARTRFTNSYRVIARRDAAPG